MKISDQLIEAFVNGEKPYLLTLLEAGYPWIRGHRVYDDSDVSLFKSLLYYGLITQYEEVVHDDQGNPSLLIVNRLTHEGKEVAEVQEAAFEVIAGKWKHYSRISNDLDDAVSRFTNKYGYSPIRNDK